MFKGGVKNRPLGYASKFLYIITLWDKAIYVSNGIMKNFQPYKKMNLIFG